MNIGLVNYGLGNIYSTTKAIEKLGYNISLVSDPDKLKLYDCLILPGVGGFPAAKNNLEKTGLIDSLKNYKNSGCYIIGVCLGMQLLMSSSKEIEDTEGLNFIQGTCKKFESGKVPHVGWNKIELLKRLYRSYTKKYIKNILISVFFTVLLAGSTFIVVDCLL